jgi:hypothetical protein
MFFTPFLAPILFFLTPFVEYSNHNCAKNLNLLHSAVLDSEMAAQKDKTLAEKIDFWSERFLGAPYGIDPLGEGRNYDPDPPFNPCVFDCETYVEEVLALSFSSNHTQMMRWLDNMRYYGYMNLAQKQFGWNLRKISRYINEKINWYPSHKLRFKIMGNLAPSGLAEIEYVPLAVLIDQYEKIKMPALGLLVGAKQGRNPFLITHMGFILSDKKKGTIWRHASGSPDRWKVEERNFKGYLTSLHKFFNKENRRYVIGMVLFELVTPEPLK